MKKSHDEFISNIIGIRDFLNKHKKFMKERSIDEQSIFYIQNINKILQSLQIQLYGENSLANFPIKKNIYEGGFNIWECELDGVKMICEQKKELDFLNKSILELGCGSGLMGITALKFGANRLVLQDYNKEVLIYHTSQNIHLNNVHQNSIEYISGSWKDLSESKQMNKFMISKDQIDHEFSQIDESFDYILAGDVLYENEHYEDLLKIFKKFLKPNGRVIILTKLFYYGNNGSFYEFEEYVKKSGSFELKILKEIQNKSSNSRYGFQLVRIN